MCKAVVAGEVWDCTFTSFDGPPGTGGHATIEISGDDLAWKLDVVRLPELSVPATTFHFHMLENNDVGFIAVSWEVANDKVLGPNASANVITFTRANMNVRIGVVGTQGAHDELTGPCRRK
jgi:hypothetical protein